MEIIYNENELNYFMSKALIEAQRSKAMLEVPVGCVIVLEGEIIARACNTRETDKNALCHAEIKAIEEACKKLGGWRLHKCDMFVTLEPCIMCAGAIVNSRIKNVYYAAEDKKAGGFGGVLNLNDFHFNHKPVLHKGILEEPASKLLSDFFKELRSSKSKKPL